MSYEAWRISYQSSEQAARAAFAECQRIDDVHDNLIAENDKLKSLLTLAMRQLDLWQKKYGEFQPEWLPPAGDVRLAEDASAGLTPNAGG